MHKHHQSSPLPAKRREACACPVFISIKDVCVVVICLASSENREKKSKQILLFHCKDDEVLSPLTGLGKGSVSEGLAGGCASVLSGNGVVTQRDYINQYLAGAEFRLQFALGKVGTQTYAGRERTNTEAFRGKNRREIVAEQE